MVRTIYQQLSPAEVHAQLDRVVEQLQEPFPQVAELLGGRHAGHLVKDDKSWPSRPSQWPTGPSLGLSPRVRASHGGRTARGSGEP